mmetsp:Transcript_22846/g.52909  ORF Transcript_22846/g.52909 Transcript_22846/m.52909 type:complete len:88 (-) Transcript_22846:452-715(-)
MVDKTYPHIPGVNYTDILVEIPTEIVIEKGKMAILESILQGRISRMLQKIESLRNTFVNGIEGKSKDTYSVLLQKRWDTAAGKVRFS